MFRNPLTDGLVVLVILILFFGPKRLPMLSRSIGESIKEFKGGIASSRKDDEDQPQLPSETENSAPAPARETAETPGERSS